MTYTLDEHVERDPRILRVYEQARRRYGEEKRHHHNFEHVLRDLYRALVIAREERSVDYGVLIPAVLLHDIGFSHPRWETLGHDEAGARLTQKLLPSMGFNEREIQGIVHSVRSHKGKAEQPRSLEAKILYDADVLEKAGLFDLVLIGKLICEFGETLHECLERECHDRGSELAAGFYTSKAKKLDGGRLAQTLSLLDRLRMEVELERPDFGIAERDLWANFPSRLDRDDANTVRNDGERTGP